MFNIFKKETKIGKPTACIFIGRSGCGKGTQVDLYMKEIKKINNEKILHIETGSFLRKMARTSSYTAQMVKKVIEVGGLMPESIVIGLWASYLMDNFDGKENLVFDGAPRRLCEATMLHSTLKFYGFYDYKVIYINVSPAWSRERLLARGRKDDTEEGIKKRMEWFDKEVMPCVEFFRKEAGECCNFIEINGEQPIEKVSKDIMEKVFNKK